MSMVKMINRITGTEMWVEEDRVPEYKALGHRRTAPTLDYLARKEEKREECKEPAAAVELKKAIKRVTSKTTTKKKA